MSVQKSEITGSIFKKIHNQAFLICQYCLSKFIHELFTYFFHWNPNLIPFFKLSKRKNSTRINISTFYSTEKSWFDQIFKYRYQCNKVFMIQYQLTISLNIYIVKVELPKIQKNYPTKITDFSECYNHVTTFYIILHHFHVLTLK